jgi:hypothetical protein
LYIEGLETFGVYPKNKETKMFNEFEAVKEDEPLPVEATYGRRGRKKQEKKTRKLCFICSKGSLDMAYPPLILANAARMSGIEVDLFFTFWGMDIITKEKMDKLHIAVVGNPNMHPSFHIPTVVGILPGMSNIASNMMR